MSHKQFYSRVSDRKNHHFVSVVDDGYIEASELEAFFKHTLHKLGMKVRDPRVRTVNDELQFVFFFNISTVKVRLD